MILWDSNKAPTDESQSSEGAFSMPCCREWISSTAFCRYIFCQVILMVCCFNSLIRLSKYLSSQFMNGDGMGFSGSLEMMENNISSNSLWSLWKNSFNRLWSLSSIFIWINSLKNFYVSWKISIFHSKYRSKWRKRQWIKMILEIL